MGQHTEDLPSRVIYAKILIPALWHGLNPLARNEALLQKAKTERAIERYQKLDPSYVLHIPGEDEKSTNGKETVKLNGHIPIQD